MFGQSSLEYNALLCSFVTLGTSMILFAKVAPSNFTSLCLRSELCPQRRFIFSTDE